MGDKESCFLLNILFCSVSSACSPFVTAHVCCTEHCLCNIMGISKPSANAVANFVHAVGLIWITQCGFKRLIGKCDLAESVASTSFKSNSLKQIEAINFCNRKAQQFPHSFPPPSAQLTTCYYSLFLYSTKATMTAACTTDP